MQTKHFLLTGLFGLSSLLSMGQSVDYYSVIPMPEKITKVNQSPFILTSQTTIVYPEGNQKLKSQATMLAKYLKDITGCSYRTSSMLSKQNCIVFDLKLNNPANDEAYKLAVNSNKITISGATEKGTFYGMQTLRKSIPVVKSVRVSLPAVVVEDAPRYAYRGMMLDVSRHFFTVDEVKRYIDILALHNVNNFHWHLSEDQGWRIEIKKYPLLTQIGSKREGTVIGRNSGKYDSIPHGGFYTQAQCREIVAYAAERNINVVPEIDMPGHMLGALASYPDLGCTGGPYKVWQQWGVSDDVLCVGNENTLQFIKDVLTELVDIFPSKYIHIGGDECPKTRWKTCPKCQAKIRELGLQADDKHSAEERLQSYFISYAEKVLNSKGRRIIGWDEILEGGIAPNATVMSWRGMDGGIQAAREKHDVIMTPNSHVYFDHYQTADTDAEPLAIGGFSSVQRVYSFEPTPSVLNDDERKHILGAQANLWTEYVPTFKQAEYMVLPRMAALCEVQWTKPELKNYDGFLKRLPRLVDLYKRYGYNYAKHLFDITPDFEANASSGSIDLCLSTLDNAPIHYTLDGTNPTNTSPTYRDVIRIKENTTIKAQVFRKDGVSRMMNEHVQFNKATTKPIRSLQAINKGYQYKGVTTLVDGLSGGTNYKTGRWIAYNKNDMELIIDLEKQTTISEAWFASCVEMGDWVFDARSFSVLVSSDGQTFTQVANENYPAMQQNARNGVYNHKLTFSPVETRFVKLIATSEKSMPAWHGAKGIPAYLFVDEIGLK